MADDEVTERTIEMPTAGPGPTAVESEPVDQPEWLTADGEPRWGLNAKGKPYRTPPNKRPGARPVRSPAAKTTARPKQPKAPTPWQQHHQTVSGLLQLPGLPLVMLGRGDSAFAADAAALALTTPAIAAAVADFAEQDERIAAVLDRLAAVGPAGALISALAPLAIQIVANHRPELAPVLGAEDPNELLNRLAMEARQNGHQTGPDGAVSAP